MTPQIEVKSISESQYEVTVREESGESTHQVKVEPAYAQELTGGDAATDELVRLSFEFLLEREPKEAILRRFDLPVIGRYFPEYEKEIRSRMQK